MLLVVVTRVVAYSVDLLVYDVFTKVDLKTHMHRVMGADQKVLSIRHFCKVRIAKATRAIHTPHRRDVLLHRRLHVPCNTQMHTDRATWWEIERRAWVRDRRVVSRHGNKVHIISDELVRQRVSNVESEVRVAD